ncbi:MAG: glycine zipper 2TM domain-containing protein [Hyphomonadaceae bacterium]
MTQISSKTAKNTRLRSRFVAPALCAVALALGGCASQQGPSAQTVTRADIGSSNAIFEGTIVSATPITVRGNNTGIGGTVGAVGGGLAGSQVGGRNSTQALGALGGAVVGGLLGNAIEGASGNASGYSYLIRGANGVVEEFPQLGNGAPIAVGAKVFVIDRPSGFVLIPEA